MMEVAVAVAACLRAPVADTAEAARAVAAVAAVVERAAARTEVAAAVAA